MNNHKQAQNFCYEHRIFYDGDECPDCKLEMWDEFIFTPQPTETFVPLEEV